MITRPEGALGPEARDLFSKARGDLAPSPDDRLRIERALAMQLGIAVTATAATTMVAKGAVGASLSAVPGARATIGVFGAGKWLLALLAVVGLGVGGVAVQRGFTSRSARPAITTEPTTPSTMTSPTMTSVPLPATASTALAIDSSEPPLLVVEAAPMVSASSLVLGTSPKAPPKVSGSVAEEAKLLADANAALHAGNPSGALALLEEHARKYPNGVLSQERAVERIFALCALGRVDQARREAARFLALHPKSPVAKTIRDSCGGTK